MQLRFRNKVILFWMFLFPIILCTLFSLVLRNVYALEEQTVIPLGIEMNEAYEQDATLQAVLQQLSEGEDALFSLEAAGGDVQEQLEQGKWIAYVQVMEDGEIALTMSGNGLEQTITEMFFDEFSQQRQLAQTWLEQGASSQELQSLFTQTRSYVTSMSAQQGITLEYVEYFSALAMACMYCGYFGIRSQQQLQANQSPLGMRLQCAPCPRHGC
ncbi:MAG: ABC transporter permease [Merdibacter sp.]